MKGRFRLRRETLREDAAAGLVLGVQSVPDGLATGLLAGVSPVAGLYGYLVGTIAGPVVYYLVRGERAEKQLDAAKGWLVLHNGAVMTVLFVVLGVALISKGLPPLGR